MPVITEIEDLKRLYRRRVPKMFYDYAESGSWTEQTFRENSSDFDLIRLRQRIAVDMAGRTTKTRMIGEDVAMPVALAPVGLTGMQHADGEIKAARRPRSSACPSRCPPCRSVRSRTWRRIPPAPSGSRSTR
jgi:L-lactate dehydrogenase (cytochrome)